MMNAKAVHATCLIYGRFGLLIRGPSGSGKSTLARLLLKDAAHRKLFHALVGDDRVMVHSRHGRLLARSIPSIAGCMEVYGQGIVSCYSEPATILHCIIDCMTSIPPRMPEVCSRQTTLSGICLPRLVYCAGWDIMDITGRIERDFDDTFMME